jgi:hypothetical protein
MAPFEKVANEIQKQFQTHKSERNGMTKNLFMNLLLKVSKIKN